MRGVINYIKNTSLTFRIISGLVLGVLTGLYFGEEVANVVCDERCARLGSGLK